MSNHKAVWTGPASRIPDLNYLEVDAGTEFEIPADVELGGEDTNYEIVGGAEHEALTKKAKTLDVKGRSKAKTRKQLADAIAAHEAEAEAAEEEKAEAEPPNPEE